MAANAYTTNMTDRTRTRGGYTPLVVSWNWWNSTQSPIPANSSATLQQRNGTLETMTDTVTSNFRQLQAKGTVVNNRLVKTSETRVCGDTGWKFQKVDGSTTYYGECFGNAMSGSFGIPKHEPCPYSSTLEVEASTAARARVVKPDVQGLVTLAELQKTISMLRRPLQGLTGLIQRDWNKRRSGKVSYQERGGFKRPSLSDIRSAAENSYLESRYGWRPFLLEIESIVKALEKKYNLRLTARAMRFDSVTEVKSYDGLNAGFYLPYTVRTQRNVTVRAGILYEHDLSLAGDFGLTWRDVPSAALELIPYSFVVGWFLNLSDFLEAITPRPGVNDLACWRTITDEKVTTRTPGTATFPDAGWATVRSPVGIDLVTTKSVTRVPSIISPAISIKTGSLRSVLTDWRALDALALFTQLLLGKPNRALRI